MRISQLSQRAGLPVGTVKFYLRTGLLHHGRATSATQAIYDESHLERLRLIRALLEVGRLSHVEIQRVLDAIDANEGNDVERVNDAVAVRAAGDEEVDLEPARALVEQVGWWIADDSPHLPHLARTLAALSSLGLMPPTERMKVYAEAASHVARSDVSAVEAAPEKERAFVAASTGVLGDALLGALHRLAVENQHARSQQRVPSPRSSVPSA
jgi:DNA-binding transcriptional MerR regulator